MKNRNKITRFNYNLKEKGEQKSLFAKFIDINQSIRHFNAKEQGKMRRTAIIATETRSKMTA